MIRKIYSILDEKAKAHGIFGFYGHDGEATRAFSDLIQDPKTSIHHHPADYTLWKLASFDDNTGIITGTKPEYVAKAIDFKNETKE